MRPSSKEVGHDKPPVPSARGRPTCSFTIIVNNDYRKCGFMVLQIVSGVRRGAVLAAAGVLAVLSIGVGWYVGYQAWVRINNTVAGQLVFSVPAFQTLDNGSLDPQAASLRVETLQLHVSGAEQTAQALFIASTALAAASMVFVATTVVLLCYRLVRGAPFGTGSTWIVAAAGITAVGAGCIVPVLEGTAKGMAVAKLPGISSVGSPIGLGDPVFYISSSVELLPLCVGLAALLLAAVFRKGDVLSRDVTGLV